LDKSRAIQFTCFHRWWSVQLHCMRTYKWNSWLWQTPFLKRNIICYDEWATIYLSGVQCLKIFKMTELVDNTVVTHHSRDLHKHNTLLLAIIRYRLLRWSIFHRQEFEHPRFYNSDSTHAAHVSSMFQMGFTCVLHDKLISLDWRAVCVYSSCVPCGLVLWPSIVRGDKSRAFQTMAFHVWVFCVVLIYVLLFVFSPPKWPILCRVGR